MKVFFLVLAFLIMTPRQLNAQNDEYRERDGNRYEGIKEENIEQVAQDRITLLSVVAKTRNVRSHMNADSLNLGFYLDSDKEVEVSVREWVKNYFMEPLKRSWRKGVDPFGWPRGIMKRNGIQCADLFALAQVVRSGVREICPVVFFTRTLPDSVVGYDFVVCPLRTMNLTYRIVDLQARQIYAEGHLNDCPRDQPAVISWNCKNRQGNYIREARLQLILEGTYLTSLEVERSLRTMFAFYHRRILY
jgi:hypothetical protein